MKRFLAVFTVVFILALSVMAFAQSGSPVASPAASISAPVQPAPSFSFIKFMQDNKSQLALFVYAFLDILVLAIPKLNGYGIIHQILVMSGKMVPADAQDPKNS